MTKQEHEKFERIRGIISEHFEDFGFVVLDEKGELFFGYKNSIIGKALFRETVKTMRELDDFETEYVWEDEDEGWQDEDE
jgi:hypothetical protein